MNNISTFTYKGQDIDVTYRNSYLAYSFEKDGNAYGLKVKVTKRGVLDIASVTFQLILNAVETLEALEKQNENK